MKKTLIVSTLVLSVFLVTYGNSVAQQQRTTVPAQVDSTEGQARAEGALTRLRDDPKAAEALFKKRDRAGLRRLLIQNGAPPELEITKIGTSTAAPRTVGTSGPGPANWPYIICKSGHHKLTCEIGWR